MKPTISIIIPIYNAAQHLRQCLQSLLEQGLESYEVLLVNDASHDNSRAICSEWCQEHPQFRLLGHETNRGAGEARNTGLRHTTGNYVTFVDADDFLAEGTLGFVLQEIGEADVAEYPIAMNHLSNHPTLWKPENKEIDFARWMQTDGYAHSYAWNKVYRRQLWEGILFPADKKVEDMFTVPFIMRKARRIKGIQQGLYYYCTREGSLSRTSDPAHLRDYVDALNALLEMPEGSSNTSLYIQALNAQITYRRAGGNATPVKARRIPWAYIMQRGLTAKQRVKALWFKLTYR